MVLRGLVRLCSLTSLNTTVCSRLAVERRVWSYGAWPCCAPFLSLDNAVFSRFDGGGEGMVLQCWAPWCPLTSLDTTVFSRLTVERRVWSYRAWYCCAPSLPSYTAVFARFDGGGEGPWCSLILA